MKQNKGNKYYLYDVYKDYKSRVDKPLDWNTFKTLCHEYNQELVDKLFEGHKVYLGHGISWVKIVRVKRYNKQIDWGETNKHRDENGKVTKFFYFTDKWYPVVKWAPRASGNPTPNISMYCFKPPRHEMKGTYKGRLIREMRDPVKKLKFELEENRKAKQIFYERRKNASKQTNKG